PATGCTDRYFPATTCAYPQVIWEYISMPQQQSSLAFFDSANSTPEFTVGLRGYNQEQVNNYIARLHQSLAQTQADKEEAERRLADAQRRLRAAEQRLGTLEQKLSDTNKQPEENSRPTLPGLGTRAEQIPRLAEEQANAHRNKPKREAEGIRSAAPLEAREITDKARAEAAAMKATAEREASEMTTAAERGAAETRVQARREADTLRADAERETKALRTATAHEVAEL